MMIIDNSGIHATNLVENSHSSITTHDIENKISSLDSVEIGLIAVKLTDTISSNFGSHTNFLLNTIFSEIQKDCADMPLVEVLKMQYRQQPKPNASSLNTTQENYSKFTMSLIEILEKGLKNYFALAKKFVEEGMTITISKNGPIDLIKTAFEQNGIVVSEGDFPKNYKIYIAVDKEQSQNYNQLTFVVRQYFEEVNLTQEFFTMKDFENHFAQSFFQQ